MRDVYIDEVKLHQLIEIVLEYRGQLSVPINAIQKEKMAVAIIKEAQKRNIPLEETKHSQEVMYMLEMDEFMPLEAYFVVARVLTKIGMLPDAR